MHLEGSTIKPLSPWWRHAVILVAFVGTFHTLEWIRAVGDLTFILLGAFPLCLAAVRGYLERERPA